MEKVETEGASFDLKEIRVVQKLNEIVKWINEHEQARGEHQPRRKGRYIRKVTSTI